MRFLATLLSATLICAALLAGVAYVVGPASRDAPGRDTGLTAQTILGTDDAAPIAEPPASESDGTRAARKLIQDLSS